MYLISGCPMHDFVAFLLLALPSLKALARTDSSSLLLSSVRVRIGQSGCRCCTTQYQKKYVID